MDLTKKEFKEFEKKIKKGLKNPVRLIPTPKLKEANKIIEKIKEVK
jgi:hypothetical protein